MKKPELKKSGLDRRDFLKSAVVGGAAAAGGTAAIATPDAAQAQQPAPAAAAAPPAAGYEFLNLDEAAFVEALVDHMVPADEISPKGTDPRARRRLGQGRPSLYARSLRTRRPERQNAALRPPHPVPRIVTIASRPS